MLGILIPLRKFKACLFKHHILKIIVCFWEKITIRQLYIHKTVLCFLIWYLPGKGSYSTAFTCWLDWINQQSSIKCGICHLSNCALGLARSMARAFPATDANINQWRPEFSSWCDASSYRWVCALHYFTMFM